MKLRYLILAFLLIVTVASLSGCKDNVWVYDFVWEHSLIRGDEVWRPMDSYYSFNKGLILTGERIGGPHFYTGDFSVTVKFDLKTSPSDMAYFEMTLGSHANLVDSEWFGGLSITDAGSPSSIIKLYHKTNLLGYEELYNAPAANLIIEDGSNVMIIEKIGDSLWIYINDVLITTSVPITEYTFGFFCPFIASWSDKVVFKKVTVEHMGDQILID